MNAHEQRCHDEALDPDAPEPEPVRLYSTREALAAIRADKSVLGDPYRLAALLDRLVAGCNEKAYEAGHAAGLLMMSDTDRDIDIDF